MTEQDAFLQRATVKAKDDAHRFKIFKPVSKSNEVITKMKTEQLRDWEFSRQQAALVKDYTLSHLAELLEEFEKNATAHGAKDAAEVR